MALFAALAPAVVRAQFAAECAPAGAPVAVVVGAVACQRLESAALGATTAFSYYVPPACGAAGARCPVLYLLHGTGSSYQTMLGRVDAPPSQFSLGWIEALTSAPAVDPRTVADPWNHADPAGWQPAPPLDLIFVAPHNRTLPGGFGPSPGVDGLWSDWNPRYAQGGDSESYPTPPPRFETSVIEEVIPFVEEHFPAGRGREWRAIDGRSQGGFGSLKLGLQHPDQFASIGGISGGGLPIGHTRAHATLRSTVPGASAPVAGPYVPLPGLLPGNYPGAGEVPNFENLITNAVRGILLGWGDPVADEANLRGQNPTDLVVNARAFSGSEQALQVFFIANDAIGRRTEDFEDPSAYANSQFFELAAVSFSTVNSDAFTGEGVEHLYEIHPGLHYPIYHRPFYRWILETHYARLRHRDGSGEPPPRATRFDYRTVRKDFRIWDWTFHVERDPVEFLNLSDVSCEDVTLRGSGVVTITVPAACGTGLGGSATFSVDLGPSMPTDEHGPTSGAGLYGNEVRVSLEAIP